MIFKACRINYTMIFLFGIASFVLFGVFNEINASSFESFHQLDKRILYCSIESCIEQSTITCNNQNEYKCAETITGFRKQYNINDPKIKCNGQTSCDINDDSDWTNNSTQYKTTLSHAFRIYLPPGAKVCNLTVLGIPRDGKLVSVARFGKPPDCEIPASYAAVPNNYSGSSIPELKNVCQFSKNLDGSIFVTNSTVFEELKENEGGWLYVDLIPYDGSGADTFNYSFRAHVGPFRKWYDAQTSNNLWLSNGDPSEQAYSYVLSVTPSSRAAGKTAGTTTFAVANSGTGTMPWTAAVTSGSSWLKITSGSSGSNAGTITSSYDANTGATSRTGTIRVTAAGASGSPKDVTVTQAGTLELSVTPSNRDVAKAAGTTTFAVANIGTGTMPWTAAVTSGSSWLKITSGGGSNAGTVTCSYSANTDALLRTGTIRITAVNATGSPKDVTVTQAGAILLSVMPEINNVTKDAGETTFGVSNTGTGTMSWTAAVTSSSSWLKITSGASGSNAGTITCSYDANTGSTARTGIIRVTATGAMGSPKEVKVTQASTPPTLSVTPPYTNVTCVDGTTTFDVKNTGTGTMPWTAAVVTDGADWLKISEGSSGTNNGTITCHYAANTTTLPRVGVIRVTAANAGGNPQDVRVSQGALAVLVPYSGLDKCYDAAGSVITCPDSGSPFFGQDANYKMNPMSYEIQGTGEDQVIKDKVTGLFWEVKRNKDNKPVYTDPHDADNVYSWYDSHPATNGGNPGTQGNNTENEDFDTEAVIARLNSNKYGGYADWRIPTIRELSSIVNYNLINPTADKEFFENLQNGLYLTAMSVADNMYNAWGINFSYGENQSTPKKSTNYVIAVSNGKPLSASNSANVTLESTAVEYLENASNPVGYYIENNTKTAVTDTSTGLMWEKVGSTAVKTWEEALNYSVGLNNIKLGGYTDWRMPTIKELSTLADYSRNVSPMINPIYFPGCFSYAYWAGTSYIYEPKQAWFVDFSNGEINYNIKSEMNAFYVRAVRNAQQIIVTPMSQTVNSNNGNTEFNVYTTVSGVSWKAVVKPGGEWLKITSGNSGTGNGTIKCSYDAKNIPEVRTATIDITVNDSSKESIAVTVTQEAKISVLGVWSDGIWAWRYATGKWTKIPNTVNAKMVAAGKVYNDTDEYDDLIGVDDTLYVYSISSSSGVKKSLSLSKPTWIVAGDVNGDNLDEVIGNWANSGVYFRDSGTGNWQKQASAAKELTTGNITGTTRDDLAGVWNDGLWVRNSTTGGWQKIDAAIPVWIAAGDMAKHNPKQADIIGSYSTETRYYDTVTKKWVKITTPAEKLASADVDGDGLDDLIGIWSGGLYVRYAANNQWKLISSSKPSWISTGTIKY